MKVNMMEKIGVTQRRECKPSIPYRYRKNMTTVSICRSVSNTEVNTPIRKISTTWTRSLFFALNKHHLIFRLSF